MTYFTAASIIEDNKSFSIVTIPEDATVSVCLETLSKNKISSAPVVANNGEIVGFIDVLDLVTFASAKFGIKNPDPTSAKLSAQQFLQPVASTLSNISGRNKWVTVSHTTPLEEIVGHLSSPNTHRVAVKNETGDIVGIITQSALAAWLLKNKGNFPKALDRLQKAVKDIWGYREGGVLTVHQNKFLIDALVRIWDTQVSGLAVVNDDYEIVGNLSASDVKRLRLQPIEQLGYDLYGPIAVFSNILTQDEQNKPAFQKLPTFAPIVLTMNSTLLDCMETCTKEGIHRVYVTDQKRHPLIEISLCDIIAQWKYVV